MSTKYKNRRSISDKLRKQVMERDGQKCQKCGFTDKYGLDAHHIISVIEGGVDAIDNLVLLCRDCHEEWHFLTRRLPGVSFGEWLQIPGVAYTMTLYTKGWYGDGTQTLANFKRLSAEVWAERRNTGWSRDEPDED